MKKQIIYICAVLAFSFASCSKMYLSKGKEDFNNYNYVQAIQSLEKSVEKKSSVEGSSLLARAYSLTGNPIAAITEYEKIIENPEISDSLRLDYASALLSSEKYDKASTVAKGILSRDPGNQQAQSIKISANRVGKMKRDSSLFQIKEKTIEGLAEVMSPVLLKNGNLVVSGEKNDMGKKDEYTGYSYLDLYEVTSDGSLNKMKVSDSKYHDGMAVFNSDNTVMYFTRTNINEKDELAANSQNISHPQLYMASKSGEDWGEPTKLPFNSSEFKYAHPALSSDGQTLYFSSNMSGGSGGMDLYKVSKSNNTWGTPENLGAQVNTPGNEVFPTLKDDNTLYFSSDSHQTLGGLDVMFSNYQGSTWNEPVHLSYPINSPQDDFGLIYTSKDKGLITSSRSSLDRLYEFEQFYPQLIVDGETTEIDSDAPIPGISITVKNLTDNTEETLVADENGKFVYELVPNKEYELIAEDTSAEQVYFNSSKKISTMGLREDETFTIDFKLEKIEVFNPLDPNSIEPDENGRYPIPNIHWDYNKWEVREDAEPYLNMLTELLELNPNLKVEVRSHCDSRGSFGFNRNLSKKRAKAVMNYLISKGISRNRLTSKGVGEKEPLNNCKDGVECTEEQHQENRRSEFIVTDKSGKKTKLD